MPIDKLLNFRLDFWVSILLSLIIGAVIFTFFFDLQILDPTYIQWLKDGDRMQHYVGSYTFRADSWHFPITKTTLLAYPEGASIIYTDSNPLLSIIFKLLRPVFPPENQFFGIWFMLCWILQSVFGFLIMNKLTKNKVYALLSAVLICLLPAMFHRIMHTNLIAFWLILWAIYIFILDDEKHFKKEVLFFLVFAVAALIHGYLCIMTIFIGGTWFLKEGIFYIKKKDFKTLGMYAFRVIMLGIIFILTLWVFGFFLQHPKWRWRHGLWQLFNEFISSL
ncbi:MAG: hypothetical protein JKX68_01210 [Flavobacteriales bacterium]|nr:hypothetical protein [Flavobacteriales bacterium]